MKRDFLEELETAKNAEINKRNDIKAAEIFMLLKEAEKDGADSAAYKAALLAFNLGYLRGYRAGANKAKAPRKMAPMQGFRIMDSEEA